MCFVSFSHSNLCQGVQVIDGTQKVVATVDHYLIHHQLELQPDLSEWCMRQFDLKNEVHHLSEKNLAGGRAPCGLLCSGQISFWSIRQIKGLSSGDQGVC